MEIMPFGLTLALFNLVFSVQSWTVLYSLPENSTHRIEKNHRLTTLDRLGKEYKISFELWVEEYHDPDTYNSR